jgi:hypothetical protein
MEILNKDKTIFLETVAVDTGVPKKKRRVHSSLIYRGILIIYTPN